DHSARAYVALYNRMSDTLAERIDEPPPALTGIQFIPDEMYLDAVATFRNLELSFWWVLNMMEIGRLLEWACSRFPKKRTARRITFYASIAEWRADPRGPFTAKLDRMPLADLTALVMSARSGTPSATDELRQLLKEKLDHTNEFNLDATGLDR